MHFYSVLRNMGLKLSLTICNDQLDSRILEIIPVSYRWRSFCSIGIMFRMIERLNFAFISQHDEKWERQSLRVDKFHAMNWSLGKRHNYDEN